MYKSHTKRIFDIVLSVIFLIIFTPAFIVIALIIFYETGLPIFADVPSRVGKGGKKFKMYKFRSMIVNAHEKLRTDPQFAALYQEYKKNSFKLNNDPRVTPFGKFIRKYSLDEIPQFFNVLKGEMSIVGPRAYYQDELDHQTETYVDTKEKVDVVLSVSPGVTGLWQVSGRSEVNFDRRILIDEQYARGVSFAGDVRIICKTPLAMLSGRGAV